MHPGHRQLTCDLNRPFPLLLEPDHCLPVDTGLSTLVDPVRFGFGDPLQLAFPSKLVSNSAKTPSMSRNALPAAVVVSIGWSAALRNAPLAFSSRTMSCRSPI